MRISLLLKREPFGSVLEQTLIQFLSRWCDHPVGVTWHKGVPYARRSTDAQVWLCNPFLNVLFIPQVKREPLLPVVREFSRSLAWWKRPIQKCYVELALTRGVSRLLATHCLEISPPLDHAESFVILGGNHHIRFHDYEAGKAYVIAKTGFDPAYMLNEVRVRTMHPFLPCPPILDTGNDGSWYSEPLILGTPINRLRNTKRAEEAITRLKSGLFQLYRATVGMDTISGYANALFQTIQKGIRDCPCLDSQTIGAVLHCAEAAISSLESEEQHSRTEIHMVQSHGDFQPANILVNADRAWLIDWEYTAKRQAGYDALVFILGARFPFGISNRIREVLSNGFMGWEYLLEDHPYIDWEDSGNRKMILSLFLLEELALKIEQDANPMISRASTGFHEFLDEMRLSLGVLRK